MKNAQFEIENEMETLLLRIEMGSSKEKDRLTANREIIEMLSRAVEENPDLRFHQILRGMNVLTENDDGEGAFENSFKRELSLESKSLFERMKTSFLSRQLSRKNA